jgi:FdhE protein
MKKSKDSMRLDGKKKPSYEAMINFYQRIKEAQDQVKATLKIEPVTLKKEWKDLLSQEGFPLLQRQDFPLDLEASADLFHTLCQLASEANPFLAQQAKKIEGTLETKKADLKALLKKGVQEKPLAKSAEEFGLDPNVLAFLVRSSIEPSIRTTAEQLHPELDPETWWKNYCPICGSLPHLSLLKEEVGKRYLLCSFCGYSWRIDRVICPFCENKDPAALRYFCAEGEESHRIEVCEKCHQYIKTIDTRTVDVQDPSLEDLATLHLDLLASQKGYRRPVPSPWVAQKQA